jgi:hypothetical protein
MLIVLPNTCHHLCYLTFIQCQLFNELEHRFVIRRGGGMGLWALSTLGSWDERWYFIHPFLHLTKVFFFFFPWYFCDLENLKNFFPNNRKISRIYSRKKIPKTSQFFSSRKLSKFPPKKTTEFACSSFLSN